MERRLHPLFQQSTNQNSNVQIQEKFDPTPVAYTNNSHIGTANSNAAEFINESKLKMNRMVQKISNLEERVNSLTQELRTTHAKLSGRFTERGLAEHKVEALIERQNAVINSFEKRMIQMSKTLEESQFQLIRTQNALDDARKEISKLKRL